MQYSFVTAAILASISSVLAQTAGFDAISVPTANQVVKVGDVLDITWAPNSVSGTVTIKLLEGSSPATLNYDPIPVASSIDNLAGSFSWTVPASVGSFATYGFQITLDSDASTFQWSNPFQIVAAATSSSSSVVASTSSTSSVASTLSSAASSLIASSQASSAFSSAATTVTHPTFTTSTTAAPVTTPYVASNGTATNGTVPGNHNITLSSSATASPTSSGVAVATGNAAISNVATGSFALLGGLVAAFML